MPVRYDAIMIAGDIFFWILPVMFASFGIALWAMARRDALLGWARFAGAGFGIGALAIILDTQRDAMVANMFVLAVPMHWLVLAFVGHAVVCREGGRTPVALNAALIAVGSLCIAWFTLVDFYSPARVTTANIVGFAIVLMSAVALHRAPPMSGLDGVRGFASLANRWLMTASAACYGIRTILYFWNGQGAEFGAAPWLSQYMLIFYFSAAVTGLATGILLLISLALDLVDHHHRASAIDPLTGIGNRRALDAIATAHAEGRAPVGALAMVDLDHFKAVNDRHGHAVGDIVLVRVAHLLRTDFADAAAVVRLGGEEFCLFIGAAHARTVATDAERMLDAISRLCFDGCDGPFHVTASAGIASLADGECVHDALRRADIGLYAAKQAGRNRIVMAPGVDDGAAAAPAPADVAAAPLPVERAA